MLLHPRLLLTLAMPDAHQQPVKRRFIYTHKRALSVSLCGRMASIMRGTRDAVWRCGAEEAWSGCPRPRAMAAPTQVPVASPCHGARGGSRYSVMAKITYTINTSTPTNHAERPLFVTSAAVMVAMSIITTAPGQCGQR
jgi:hypothetical protein